MKMVILDTSGIDRDDLDWSAFRKFGEFDSYSDVGDEDEVIRRIGDAEIIVNNKTSITKRVLDSCPNIRMITEIATGYDNVDVNHAASLGIPVCNVPEYATKAVAQFTFALILELCHHIAEHNRSVQAGDWCRSRDFCYWLTPQIELSGKTLGIIGYGKIGKCVAQIARALDMNVLAYSPHYEQGATLDEIYEKSDIISLNCRVTDENKGLINKETIGKMKRGVWIINTARGALINEADLRGALSSGQVGAAAMDAISCEPMNEDNPLLGATNCIITPHMAWTTRECRQRALDITAENIENFLSGTPQNIVNEVS